MNRENLKTALKITGLIVLLTGYVMFLYTFLGAYLSPSKDFTFYIDRHGEANFEFVVLTSTIPCAFFAIYKIFNGDFQVEHEAMKI